MNISMIILVLTFSVMEGYRSARKTEDKAFDIKSFLESFLIVAIGVSVLGPLGMFLIDWILDTNVAEDQNIGYWLWVGIFLFIAIYLPMKVFKRNKH
ncbi:hypothetical protein [Pseudalkalibacillus sp. SCS-8]|uniref:hypothetical protein n=1 Tax=Pseudalkalibacillus nanhaiensis TaxID=3115291 RepID=UPI0032DBB037